MKKHDPQKVKQDYLAWKQANPGKTDIEAFKALGVSVSWGAAMKAKYKLAGKREGKIKRRRRSTRPELISLPMSAPLTTPTPLSLILGSPEQIAEVLTRLGARG